MDMAMETFIGAYAPLLTNHAPSANLETSGTFAGIEVTRAIRLCTSRCAFGCGKMNGAYYSRRDGEMAPSLRLGAFSALDRISNDARKAIQRRRHLRRPSGKSPYCAQGYNRAHYHPIYHYVVTYYPASPISHFGEAFLLASSGGLRTKRNTSRMNIRIGHIVTMARCQVLVVNCRLGNWL